MLKCEKQSDDDKKYIQYEPSLFKNVILLLASILFICFVWRMIPISNVLKICGLVFGGCGVLAIMCNFPEYLCYFKIIKSTNFAIATTIILFLIFPVTINFVSDLHKNDYLKSSPDDGQISLKINCDVKMIKSGSIGDEWSYIHFFNGEQFKNGDCITFNAYRPFNITSRIIEHDGISDVGETTSVDYNYLTNENYNEEMIVSNFVHVVEEGGRRYAGANADFEVIYKLKRTVPLSMNFWDVFLYTSSNSEKIFCNFLIVGQIFFVLVVIFVFIVGSKRRTYEEKQEKLRKEKEFSSGRELLLKELNGRSIRDVAGVPEHIKFVNGLPVDNNDAIYGSFTVYCSKSGKRYHKKRGCCSARYPMHYLVAKNKYKPCSKCCTVNITVPKWYEYYKTLIEQATYYQININDEL